MMVFLNGRFVPEEQALVSVFDRSFLYGDGLFETLRVFNGRPFRWQQHWERLARGAQFLNLKIPATAEALRGAADELVASNRMPDALLRLTLSRGVGTRGYSPKGATHPTLVMSLHPAPFPVPGRTAPRSGGGARTEGEGSLTKWKLITASPRLPAGEPLAQFKTCNKLPQILGRAEADAAGAEEALLLNTDGFIVEATSSNLFWIEGDAVCTAPLAGGILAGVTRAVVLELCGSLGVPTRESNLTPDELKKCDGVFLTLSSWGIVEADALGEQPLRLSPLIQKLRAAYWDLIRAETGAAARTED